MLTTKQRDLNIWRELAAGSDGYVPAVPREYYWRGTRNGQQCNILCRLIAPHGDGAYRASAIFAHNVAFLPASVRLAELVEA